MFDEGAVAAHADAVASKAAGIDIMLNAIAVAHVQGNPFMETSLAEFDQPITATARVQFIPAQAVARHMITRQRGVILTLTTPGGRIAGKGFLTNGVFSAATEAFSRLLAAELGGHGIRVVCLRPDAIPDAVRSGSREVFEGFSAASAVAEMLANTPACHLVSRLPRWPKSPSSLAAIRRAAP